jgi:hypothetical protein
MSHMAEVEDDGEWVFLRPSQSSPLRGALERDEEFMVRVCHIVRYTPLTLWALREEIAIRGYYVEDDNLLESIRQLLARGRLVQVSGRLTTPPYYTEVGSIPGTSVGMPAEPRALSRFDIIDGDVQGPDKP